MSPDLKKTKGYLHGYSREEQDRLTWQARMVESAVFESLPFPPSWKDESFHLLEIGCGVGAQTEILLERFPKMRITGVDASPEQLERAKQRLKDPISKGRVELIQANASSIPFADGNFDGAFICWFLEHVADPVEILKETRRLLKPGAWVFCNEVMNATFFIEPYAPATLKYWFEYNDYQWELGGDPFAGGKLGNFLLNSGFKSIKTQLVSKHYDERNPKQRAEFVEFWTQLLLSGSEGLLKANKVDESTVQQMTRELEELKNAGDGVLFYAWIQALGQT